MKYSVVAVEDGIACLENDENSIIRVCAEILPENVKEGVILRYDGVSYVIDDEATTEHRRQVYDKFNRLFKK